MAAHIHTPPQALTTPCHPIYNQPVLVTSGHLWLGDTGTDGDKVSLGDGSYVSGPQYYSYFYSVG